MSTVAVRQDPDDQARYETDYYSWIQEQVVLLRAGRLAELDAENIAEELSDLGKSQLWRLQSSLKILIMHMLEMGSADGASVVVLGGFNPGASATDRQTAAPEPRFEAAAGRSSRRRLRGCRHVGGKRDRVARRRVSTHLSLQLDRPARASLRDRRQGRSFEVTCRADRTRTLQSSSFDVLGKPTSFHSWSDILEREFRYDAPEPSKSTL
jgi:hypothetical protein